MRCGLPLITTLLCTTLAACGANQPKTDPAPDAGTPTEQGAAPQPAAAAKAVRPTPTPAYFASTLGGDYTDNPGTLALIDRLQKEQGFDRNYLYGVFSGVARQQWILDYLNRPGRQGPPLPGSWTRYRNRFITGDRIEKGVAFWKAHAGDLLRAEATYGVPAEYITAIIGVETHYGRNVGKHRVIDALSTLAFDYPRRADFFSGELEHFLVMARDEGFDPFVPVGSYAGAMGLGQFMPSSFRQYAVDFNGDGHRDLWNPVDAIGSVANYFRGHGWRSGEPVAVTAQARGQAPRLMEAGFTSRYTPFALEQQGVRSSIPLDGEHEVSLLRLEATTGPEYWIGLHNFYVITRYNHSTYYAMAVHQLAQALRDRVRQSGTPVLSYVPPPAGAAN